MIGVMGGTFDPPHIAHLLLADLGRFAFELERVLWVVTAVPPHKPDQPISPVEDRLMMVKAAIRGNPDFEISLADHDRPAPHYAIDTMHWLQDRFPRTRFMYLMGSDSIRDLPTWHNPSGFVAACHQLGVMHRPGVEMDLHDLESEIPGLMEKVRFFDAPLIECSGRDIRQRVRQGLPYRYFLPPDVAAFIEKRDLYR
jgi:nicotinate-nucleotide adenylyltransferase